MTNKSGVFICKEKRFDTYYFGKEYKDKTLLLEFKKLVLCRRYQDDYNYFEERYDIIDFYNILFNLEILEQFKPALEFLETNSIKHFLRDQRCTYFLKSLLKYKEFCEEEYSV